MDTRYFIAGRMSVGLRFCDSRFSGRLYSVDALPDDPTCARSHRRIPVRFTTRPDPSQTGKVRQVNKRAFRTLVYRR